MLKSVSLDFDLPIKQTHKIPVQGMCPVSGEPQVGSFVKISYTTQSLALDVLTTRAFVNSFYNSTETRDLEAVCVQVAKDAQEALGFPVKVTGVFLLKDGQSLKTTTYPPPPCGINVG